MPHFVSWFVELCKNHSNITTGAITLALSYPVFVVSKAAHDFLRLRGVFIKHRWVASRYIAMLRELDAITYYTKDLTRLVVAGIQLILAAVILSFAALTLAYVDAISKYPQPNLISIVLVGITCLLLFVFVRYNSWSRAVGNYDEAFHRVDEKIVRFRSQLETNGIDVGILERKNKISYDMVVKEVHKIRRRDEQDHSHQTA
jgi:hypothetical protein